MGLHTFIGQYPINVIKGDRIKQSVPRVMNMA